MPKYIVEQLMIYREYTEERIAYFKEKEYFWNGVSYKDADGFVAYRYPNGDTNEPKEILIK